jgi:hypothetical protein
MFCADFVLDACEASLALCVAPNAQLFKMCRWKPPRQMVRSRPSLSKKTRNR